MMTGNPSKDTKWENLNLEKQKPLKFRVSVAFVGYPRRNEKQTVSIKHCADLVKDDYMRKITLKRKELDRPHM